MAQAEQGKGVWRLDMTTSKQAAEAVAAALEDSFEVVSAFEQPDGQTWRIQIFSEARPDADLAKRLFETQGFPAPDMALEELPPTDWLAASYASFPPIEAGRFFVHGSHFAGQPPKGATPLLIDAATAFGSGEHATTKGCLLAIDRFASEGMAARRALDMGCGSGILAFAIAKAMNVPVLGVDNDAESVRVARENAEANGVADLVQVECGDGYAAPQVAEQGPFDLIMSNILAGPLVQFAPDLARHLAPHGVAVLSGLLREQEAKVLAAHEAQGLEAFARWPIGDWMTVAIRRKA